MARRKKDPEPGDTNRNGHDGANGAAEARARGRAGTATRTRRTTKAGGGGAADFRQELRSAQQQSLREVREGYEKLGKELTAATGRLAESVRHAQEQLSEIVRQAREARRDVEELRELARDAHREGIGEPATGDPAGAADGGHGAPRGGRGRGRKADRAAGGREEGRGGRARKAAAENRNRFGVTVGGGVVVAEVSAGSPAEDAGLKRGDVIEEVNGTEIVSATQLRDAVGAAGGDAEVTLRVIRAGEPQEVRAKVGKAAADGNGGEGRNQLGVTVGPGVVVAEVLPDTPAARAGLKRGDVIEDVNGTAVLSGEQFRQVVQQAPGGSEAVLRVTRAGQVREARAALEA
jgi:hypothetical protein